MQHWYEHQRTTALFCVLHQLSALLVKENVKSSFFQCMRRKFDCSFVSKGRGRISASLLENSLVSLLMWDLSCARARLHLFVKVQVLMSTVPPGFCGLSFAVSSLNQKRNQHFFQTISEFFLICTKLHHLHFSIRIIVAFTKFIQNASQKARLVPSLFRDISALDL